MLYRERLLTVMREKNPSKFISLQKQGQLEAYVDRLGAAAGEQVRQAMAGREDDPNFERMMEETALAAAEEEAVAPI